MNQIHRLGRWSVSLFALLGVSASLAHAQERGEIPQVEQAVPVNASPVAALTESHEVFSFVFAMNSSPTLWLAKIPKKASPEQAAITISIFATPAQEGAAPVATIEVNDAQILWSPDPLMPGFALFVKIEGLETPPILFAWDEAGGIYQMLGQVAGNLLGPLYGDAPSAAAPPPPLDFQLIVAALGWDAQVAELLAAMYRIASFANAGDSQAAQIFVDLFLLLPPEAQELVLTFLTLSLQTENSPYASIVEWVVQNAAPAYQSYLEKQKALLGIYYVVASEAPFSSTGEASAQESAAIESGEWAPDAAFASVDRSRREGGIDWQAVDSPFSLRGPALAHRDDSFDRDEEGRDAKKTGSRIGAQDAAGTRASRAQSDAQRGRRLQDFLAGFGSKQLPYGIDFSFAPQEPGDPRPKDDREQLQAIVELRRRLFSAPSAS